MADEKTGWLARIAGAAIGAGGSYVALLVTTWEPDVMVIAGICAAMGVLGLALGPKIWEAVIGLA